jgi:ribonuclease HI
MSSKIKIYSDGGARGNPGPAAIGVLICDAKGDPIQEHSETIGKATNNVAEYTAVLVGLHLAKQVGASEIDYFVDSELVARQLSGDYRIKTPHIRSLFMQVKEAEKPFHRVTFKQIPRTHEKIRYVDKLVNKALNREGY